jgi:hypothetical protein
MLRATLGDEVEGAEVLVFGVPVTHAQISR